MESSELWAIYSVSIHCVLKKNNCAIANILIFRPEVKKNLFSCSTHPSVKFLLLVNLKLLTIANAFLLNIAKHGHLC